MWGTNFEGGAGAAGGGGGGFMTQQTESPGANKNRPGSRKTQNLMPLTVKQLLDSPDETLTIEGIEVHQITIVGLVTKVITSTTKITVHIDDQTGTIECMFYVGTDEQGENEAPFVPVEGTYGRVIGALRVGNAKQSRYLVMYRFLPVTDMNELTCHLLEVIQVPMKLKKLREAEAQKTGVGLGMDNVRELPGSMMANMNTSRGAGPTGQIQAGGGGGDKKSAFKPAQAMVLSIIQMNRSESGIHKDELFLNLKGKASVKEIEQILEDLSSEGHIFSTIDDDHYRSTD